MLIAIYMVYGKRRKYESYRFEKLLVSLAGPANKQGRIVADNVCGILSSLKERDEAER